jgi:hypothetical protein
MNTTINNAQAIEAAVVVLSDSDNALANLQSSIASLSKKESHLAKVALEFQTRQIDFFDSLVAVLQVAQQDFGLYGKLGKLLSTVSNPIIKAVMAAKNVDGIALKDAYAFDINIKSFKLKKNQQHTAAAFLETVVNPFKPVVTETSDTPNGGNGGNGDNGDNGDTSNGGNGGNGESDKPKATDLEKDIKSLDAIVKAISAINKRNTKQPLIGADVVTSIADLLADCQTRQAQIVEKYAAIKAAADAESAAQEQKAA